MTIDLPDDMSNVKFIKFKISGGKLHIITTEELKPPTDGWFCLPLPPNTTKDSIVSMLSSIK